MNYVQVITTEPEHATYFSSDLNERKKPFAFEHILQHIVANQSYDLKFSTTYCLQKDTYSYRTIFKITIDVIEAMLNKHSLGVILIHRLELVDELAFYLSLFTRAYRKPIVLYTASEKNLFENNYNNIIFLPDQRDRILEKQIEVDTSYNDLRHALDVASNRTYGMLEPLTISKGNLYLASYSEEKYVKMIEQLGNEQNPLQNIMPEPYILQLGNSVSKKIRQIPVIPEKVIIIRLLIDVTGEEVINIGQHYAGVVFEVHDGTTIHPTVLEAMEQLIYQNIPVIITFGMKGQRTVSFELQNTFKRLGVWTTKQLQSSHARILLGVMLAQKMSRDEMAEVCALYNET